MTEKADRRNYRSTLNLPKTSFAMKANLVQNERTSQKKWDTEDLYGQLRRRPATRGNFIFHDGPPYANGSIHLGHLLNKVLKDFVVRSRSMEGFDCPYVPGWDCHGLPIEHKVMQGLGEKARDFTPMQIRKRCADAATKFIKLQRTQMQRLLTVADYANPYLTMDPAYESAVLEVFAELVQRGVVYRDLKPVHWSIENRTALAEAELEYYDRTDTSVYALFDLHDTTRLPTALQVGVGMPVALAIWTTTPWTLPANLAVAVSPAATYGLYRFTLENAVRHAIVAEALAPKVLGSAFADATRVGACTGTDLASCGAVYDHPFVNRQGSIVDADYVTLEDGTGLVHTAPGHGTEDYLTGRKHGLEIYCPVRADGTFDDTAPVWLQGKSVWDANPLVVEQLRSSGHLVREEAYAHSYPHDWRGKTPVIFRATEQWFVNVNGPVVHGKDDRDQPLIQRALAATESAVNFVPAWGRNRLRGMLATRPDWCLSRQRAWGLPIPAFFDREGRTLLTAASVQAVATVIRERGSDTWFTAPCSDLLRDYDPSGDPAAPEWARGLDPTTLAASLEKATDIFDVWFESGSSWHAVIRQRFGDDAFPTDLYLEGSDQHRGWFQLSLLPSLGVTGQSPFRTVVTHGFMVDKDGRKMSKSLGNTLEVEELLKEFGADVCRWWVCSLNTDNDIKVDHTFFQLAGEAYRKVRNTIRYLLSNLNDFDPPKHRHNFTDADATSIDAWALSRLHELVTQVRRGFDEYAYRRTHDALFLFCNETMSSIYLTAVKDRLYCDPCDSPRRRRTQSAIHQIADTLIRLLAPILPHTADEAWHALHGPDADSVHLALFPEAITPPLDGAWADLADRRNAWMRAIETARQAMEVDNPLDLGLVLGLRIDSPLRRLDPVDLADICGISRVEIQDHDQTPTVLDLRGEPRCERSWKRDGTVRPRADGAVLSDRDADALEGRAV